jgi:DNA gyrase inhibitor
MRSKKMNVEIVEREESKTAGFHLVGPWEVTAPEGFDKLVAWTSKHNVMGPWMGVYHGNPRAVPAEELKIETVICLKGVRAPGSASFPPEPMR